MSAIPLALDDGQFTEASYEKFEFTDEEIKAVIIQLDGRLDNFKEMAENSKDYDRILEITEAIKPIKSVRDKLLGL